MLSYSKFSDLETWLCMPSSLLLPRALDSAHTSSSSSNSSSSHASNSPPVSSSSSPASNSRRSTYSEPGEADTPTGNTDATSAGLYITVTNTVKKLLMNVGNENDSTVSEKI
ncbi:hypothetical protein INR49_020213 [Caranx melampygus]|nr:hypothetical protein INR49_020213 [Caranx melampygus]